MSTFQALYLICVFLSVVGRALGPKYCEKGYYLFGEEECRPCDVGMYMPEDKHTNTYCWHCDEDPLDGELKQVNRVCTWTSNTEIGCVPGAFRHQRSQMRPFDCLLCTVCKEGEHELQACTEHSNRKCQTSPSSTVTVDSDDNLGPTTPDPPIHQTQTFPSNEGNGGNRMVETCTFTEEASNLSLGEKVIIGLSVANLVCVLFFGVVVYKKMLPSQDRRPLDTVTSDAGTPSHPQVAGVDSILLHSIDTGIDVSLF